MLILLQSFVILLVGIIPSVILHCTESDTELVCSNSQDHMAFEDLQDFGQRHPNLSKVVFTGHNIPYLGKNSLGAVRHDSLHTYNLSNNNIKKIDPGAFHFMRNLKTLILDDNDWNFNANVDHPRVFNHSQLTTLSLNNAFAPLNTADKNSSEVFEMLDVIFTNSSMESLVSLSMRNNRIDGLPVDFFDNMTNLEVLDLSYNHLPRVAFNLLALEKLKILNLHWNSMTHIDNSLLFNLSLMYNGGRGQLQTVTLYKNPIACDCSVHDLWRWLNTNNKTLVEDTDKLTCSSAPLDTMVGSPLMSFTLADLVCKKPPKGETYIVLGVVLGIVGAVAMVILFLNRSFFIGKYRSCRETLGSKHEHSVYSTTRYDSVR